MPTIRTTTAACLAAATSLALTVTAAAQDLTVTAPPQDRPILIHNATIHPVTAPPIEDGHVLFEDGRIVGVGRGVPDTLPDDTDRIDAEGMHVYPGLIGADTRLGLVEINAVRATLDFNESGDFTPEARACVAINPDSALLPVTRHNGVLTVASFPSGGRVPGQASIIQLEGWTWEEMTVRCDAGLVVNWPSVRPSHEWWADPSPRRQRERIERQLKEVHEFFDKAVAYHEARRADSSHPADLRYEAMRPFLPDAEEQRPLYIRAQEADQMLSAITWATDRGYRPVIIGGRDAMQIVDHLLEHEVGVIITGTQRFPSRADAPYDEAYTLPKQLEEAGVDWALASGHGPHQERNLGHVAAMAAAHGMDHRAALWGITQGAADLLGVGDELGSIELGKRATLMITDGNPLEMTTRVHRAFIEGRDIDLSNKQTELAEKYRQRYRQMGLIEDNED